MSLTLRGEKIADTHNKDLECLYILAIFVLCYI